MSESTQFVREDRAFYNVTGDSYLYPVDRFVGRTEEIHALRAAIDSTPSRIVTVVGTAGVGKTRLALEALRTTENYYAGGAVIVRLAAIDRADNIIPEIARALGMIDQAERLNELVREALATEPTVLLLDCFEHLLPEASQVVACLLEDCPQLHVVLTSRRPTGLPGEVVLELHPLTVISTQDPEELLQSDAVQLFLDRAHRAREWFTLQDGDVEIIARLCAHYDGLPLAIELLASWIAVLSPKELLEWQPDELAFRLPVADPRHQRLLDTIAWSFELLQPEARTLLARLSIFVGGFSRDSIELIARGHRAGAGYVYADGYPTLTPYGIERAEPPVCESQNPEIAQELSAIDADPVLLLATLIDHRLVYQSGEIDGVPRFDMLETIREFGRHHLQERGYTEAVRHAHAATMAAFCEASGEGFWHSSERLWNRERVDADLQNIRTALAWANQQGDDGVELAARIAGPLWNYWQTRGLITEGRRYLDWCLFTPVTKNWIRRKELPGLAFLCWIQGDDERCEEVVNAGLEATASPDAIDSRGMLYLIKALLEFRKGPEHVLTMVGYADEAERFFSEAGDKNGAGACYLIFGQISRLSGKTEQALELFETARELHIESGYDWGVAAGYYFAAEATRDLAEIDSDALKPTVTLLYEALQRFWSMGDFWGTGGAMSGLACVMAMQKSDLPAATYFGAAQVLMERVGGSLLPSELMTHHETEAELQARMQPSVWHEAFERGRQTPDVFVEQALADITSLLTDSDGAVPPPRLTRIQLAAVEDIVQGYDVEQMARRRRRSKGATYDLIGRILERLNLRSREEIAAYAIKHGLVDPISGQADFNSPQD